MRKAHRFLATLFALVFSFCTVARAEKTPDERIEDAKSAIYSVFSYVDCQYTISGNASGFVVQYSQEDMSMTVLMSYLFGNEETDAIWREFRTANIDLYTELYSYIEQCGIQKPNLTIMLTDYEEKESVYLMIVNGQVVYDFLAK